MKAMILDQVYDLAKVEWPLKLVEVPLPSIEADEVLLRISVCGVCHTELDEIEGRTLPPKFPVVLGHQVVGKVEEIGSSVEGIEKGVRVGVAWIFSACGVCNYCRSGEENLCKDFKATGRDANGGYAEFMAVPGKFVYPIPDSFSDSEAAPLLCAGAIGYRSVRLTNLKDGQNLGLTGFGASAHLVLKMVRFQYPEVKVFVFARSEKEREFARELGAVWTGDTTENAPEKLQAVIDTTPVWKPVLEALANLTPGGRLVINAIRKENADLDYLQKLDYSKHLWLEKEIKSVANVTRRDVSEFLELAADMAVKPDVEEYELAQANQALMELKNGKIRGAKVLRIRKL